ncbi:MAG: hypothetical protein M3Z35_18405, partial [Nitrospirota bacterium]|nr:hypothetical protein [Nitrospirota bacterium]
DLRLDLPVLRQDVETGRRRRSWLVRILDVAQGYACSADGACGLDREGVRLDAPGAGGCDIGPV